MTKRIATALLIGLTVAALALAQTPNFKDPDEPQTEEKTYVKDTPLRAELKRRLSEQALEENLPKAMEVFKAVNTNELAAELNWNQAMSRAYSSWLDVIDNQKVSGEVPPDQIAWREEQQDFLTTLNAKGKVMVIRNAERADRAKLRTNSAENTPGSLEELKKDLLEADGILAEAEGLIGKKWTRDQLKDASAFMDRVKKAVNLLSAVMSELIAREEHLQRLKAKPEFSSEENAIINMWKGLPDSKSMVQKSFRQMPKDHMIPASQARLADDIKAWEALSKAYEPVIKKTINSSCRLFNGSDWGGFVDKAKRIQDALARQIAGQGDFGVLSPEEEAAEEAITKKERERMREIYSQMNPLIERNLELALIRADSESEVKAAEAAIAKYKAEATKLQAEYVQIIEKHKARRKKLGIPPAFE